MAQIRQFMSKFLSLLVVEGPIRAMEKRSILLAMMRRPQLASSGTAEGSTHCIMRFFLW
jgi:hypothetical protein